MTRRQRMLALLLRLLGTIDLLALVAVVAPRRWLEASHAALGMGPFPNEPVVGYLARSASAMYALHGATVVFLSFDVVRYRRLITFLASVALLHGLIMLGIDLAEGMPRWWTIGEGPAFAASGGVVLFVQWLASRGNGGESQS